MSAPSYKTNDPKGWGGDPKRGAAVGRGSILDPDRELRGPFTLRRVYLDSGGYDPNGTYFGHGSPLYWYALTNSDGETIVDAMVRAVSRDAAQVKIRQEYPAAVFYDDKRRKPRGNPNEGASQ